MVSPLTCSNFVWISNKSKVAKAAFMSELRLAIRAPMRSAIQAVIISLLSYSVYVGAETVAVKCLKISDFEEESLVLSSSAVNYYLLECRERQYSVHPINVARNKYGNTIICTVIYHNIQKNL